MELPETKRRANCVIERAIELHDHADELRAYQRLLQKAFSDPIRLDRPHQRALRVVRAGVLRSAIGLVCAILGEVGEDRANLKQIFAMLDEQAVAECLTDPDLPRMPRPDRKKLEAARTRRERLATSDEYRRVRPLRNSLAHLLGEVDTVENSEVFWLADQIDACVTELFQGIGLARRSSSFSEEDAVLFRETYLRGTSASA
jgi:hypothetical protein